MHHTISVFSEKCGLGRTGNSNLDALQDTASGWHLSAKNTFAKKKQNSLAHSYFGFCTDKYVLSGGPLVAPVAQSVAHCVQIPHQLQLALHVQTRRSQQQGASCVCFGVCTYAKICLFNLVVLLSFVSTRRVESRVSRLVNMCVISASVLIPYANVSRSGVV